MSLSAEISGHEFLAWPLWLLAVLYRWHSLEGDWAVAYGHGFRYLLPSLLSTAGLYGRWPCLRGSTFYDHLKWSILNM